LKWLSGDLQGNEPQPFLPFFKQRYFSSPEAQSFLRTLAKILDVEYQTFYREFWKRRYDIHPLKEKAVLYADYLLCKRKVQRSLGKIVAMKIEWLPLKQVYKKLTNPLS